MSEEAAIEAAQADGRDFVTEADVQQAEAPERPEWLPEKYNTGEDLAKAYKELESKLGGKEEDIRNKLLEEIQAEAFGDRPETAGDYQLPDVVDETWLLITNYSSGGLSIHLRMAIAKKSFRKALRCMPKLSMGHSQI